MYKKMFIHFFYSFILIRSPLIYYSFICLNACPCYKIMCSFLRFNVPWCTKCILLTKLFEKICWIYGRHYGRREVNLKCNFIQAKVAYFANLNVLGVCGWEKANDELLWNCFIRYFYATNTFGSPRTTTFSFPVTDCSFQCNISFTYE